MKYGVSNKNTFNQQKSESLGAALIKEIGKSYKTFPALVKRKVGIWVLDKNVYPSVLIECGYITDKQDREFISKKENQELIDQKIIRAIELYASQNVTGKVSVFKVILTAFGVSGTRSIKLFLEETLPVAF